MQKNELRSVIFNLLPKYAKGSEYHKEVIDRAIEKVINQLYTQTFLLDPLSIQRYVKRFGTVTPITVSYDTNTGIYYSNYPTGVMPVSLPDKASGCRRITTKAQAGIKFYPTDQREMELVMGGSYTNTVTNKVGYCVTQDRIEFYGMPASIVADGLRLDLLVPFSDYAETDQILVPEMPDPQGATFTDMVLKILGVIRPQDTLDNNLDTAVNTKE
jgi:hypothetical protein